ncbi:hypothetical protein BGX24_002056, partial [Mortierella sp. AD032]
MRSPKMNNHPLEQLDPRASDESNATTHKKKPSIFGNIFGGSTAKSNEVDPKEVNPKEVNSKQVNPKDSSQSTTPIVAQHKPLPTLPAAQNSLLHDNIFPNNVAKPVIKAELPRLHQRIERTDQVVYCNALLLKALMSSDTTEVDKAELHKAELDWLEEIRKDPMEQGHLRWLANRMVEEFVADTIMDSTEIAEIVALGPILHREPYRKLLTSLLKDFDGAYILDDYLLQGLIQLIQTASPGHLEADDLVKILSILRVRLQGTHQQSTEHTHLLTLAVSGILDVMADHKALQYVPDNETALQSLLKHSTNALGGLVKITSVFTLDLVSILEGLDNLKESIGGIVSVASTVYEGAPLLMESGQGVFDSLNEGFSTGKKGIWYAAIKAAYGCAQAGQLRDLKQLILEAPCRCDPLFQWGICQLLGEISMDP